MCWMLHQYGKAASPKDQSFPSSLSESSVGAANQTTIIAERHPDPSNSQTMTSSAQNISRD